MKKLILTFFILALSLSAFAKNYDIKAQLVVNDNWSDKYYVYSYDLNHQSLYLKLYFPKSEFSKESIDNEIQIGVFRWGPTRKYVRKFIFPPMDQNYSPRYTYTEDDENLILNVEIIDGLYNSYNRGWFEASIKAKSANSTNFATISFQTGYAGSDNGYVATNVSWYEEYGSIYSQKRKFSHEVGKKNFNKKFSVSVGRNQPYWKMLTK